MKLGEGWREEEKRRKNSNYFFFLVRNVSIRKYLNIDNNNVKNTKKKKKTDKTETNYLSLFSYSGTNHNIDIKTQAKINST